MGRGRPVLLTLGHLDQVVEIMLDSLGHYDIPWVGFPGSLSHFHCCKWIGAT
jgi:hypothetical protein